MKDSILYLFKEKHFLRWDLLNARIEAPLVLALDCSWTIFDIVVFFSQPVNLTESYSTTWLCHGPQELKNDLPYRWNNVYLWKMIVGSVHLELKSAKIKWPCAHAFVALPCFWVDERSRHSLSVHRYPSRNICVLWDCRAAVVDAAFYSSNLLTAHGAAKALGCDAKSFICGG